MNKAALILPLLVLLFVPRLAFTSDNSVNFEIKFKSDTKVYSNQEIRFYVRTVDEYGQVKLPIDNKTSYSTVTNANGVAKFQVLFPDGKRWIEIIVALKGLPFWETPTKSFSILEHEKKVVLTLNPEHMRLLPRKNIQPEEYPNLPFRVVNWLNGKSCIIAQPQDYDFPFPVNVVKGDFSGDGTEDWAALCMFKDGGTSIEVLWGDKKPACSSRVVDNNYRPNTGIEISIGVSSMFDVRYHAEFEYFYFQYAPEHGIEPNDENYDKYLSSLPEPKVFWKGVDEYLIGKAGNSYYCIDGKWVVKGTSD